MINSSPKRPPLNCPCCLNCLDCQDLCSGFSLEALNGFMFGVDATKSLILTLACIERVITVEEAVRISSNT